MLIEQLLNITPKVFNALMNSYTELGNIRYNTVNGKLINIPNDGKTKLPFL